MRRMLFALGALTLSANLAHAGDLRLDSSAIAGESGLHALSHPWRYHPGDDPRWAARDFDDSGWTRTESLLVAGEQFPGEWVGIAWLRTSIDVAPDLADRPLAMWIRIYGATEIYLDGALVRSIGRIENGAAVTPEPLTLDPRTPIWIDFGRAGPHVLAVRYATNSMAYAVQVGLYRGVAISIGDMERSVHHRTLKALEYHGIEEFFGGAALVLATLHLLIFLFMRSQSENLYFALATISVAGIAYFSGQWAVINTMPDAVLSTTMFKVSLISTVVFSLCFYYRVFMERLPIYFFIFAAVSAILALSAYWLSFRAVYIFAVLSFIEPLRVLLKAMIARKQDAWIIAAGGAISMSGAVAQMLPLILGGDFADNPSPVYLYGFLALLLSMSIYLARRFARTHQSLREQLHNVNELSDLTIRQAVERERLEAENQASKKREAVLAELQVAHEDLKHTQAKLAQSEKMASLGQLVAGVAHEINTPVGAIHSMRDSMAKATEKLKAELERLHPETLEEPAVKRSLAVWQDGLHVIESGSVRVTGIVKRLRTFARLDEAELQLADLHAGLEDTLVLLSHELKRGIEVERDYGDLPKISCYPGQLNQVFLNLLVNAAQAISGKGKIAIKTRAVGSQVVIEIRDTGSGIPPDVLPRIFDPGFTTKGVGVGTGLGLSIVYRIVQDHQGEITVESERGRGTTFTLRLPIAPTRTPA